MNNHIINVFDLSAYEQAEREIPGLREYGSWCLMFPAPQVAVIMASRGERAAITGYGQWLCGRGIGTSEILYTAPHDGGLIEALLVDEDAKQALRAYIARGYKLNFFTTNEQGTRLLKALGSTVNWTENTVNIAPEFRADLDLPQVLYDDLEKRGLAGILPHPRHFGTTPVDIGNAVTRILMATPSAPAVLVSPCLLAGGAGSELVLRRDSHPSETAQRHVQRWSQGGTEIFIVRPTMVESTGFGIHFQNGVPSCASYRFETGERIHVGSALFRNELPPELLDPHAYARLLGAAHRVATVFRNRVTRGPYAVNFTLEKNGWVQDPETKITDGESRVGVLRGMNIRNLSEGFGESLGEQAWGSEWGGGRCVIQRGLDLPRDRGGFQRLMKDLGDLVFDPTTKRGAVLRLPFATLDRDHPWRTHMIVLADEFDAGIDQCREIATRLGGRIPGTK